jgi:hypothetical protein
MMLDRPLAKHPTRHKWMKTHSLIHSVKFKIMLVYSQMKSKWLGLGLGLK